MFNREVELEIVAAAERLGVEAAALLAVAEVESAGKAYATVQGRREPLIRFEGHYFDRRLADHKRERARVAGLADPAAGAVRNPAGQAARWALLARAEAIDRQAARESASWGLGQVMGAHWAWLGYASVDELVAEARSGAGGQATLMARYINKAGLLPALRSHDWAAFARGYNGPAYRQNAYDTKLAAAYAQHAAGAEASALPSSPEIPGLLRRGSRGEAVLDLQTLLSALGYPVARDGIFGPETERAVRRFQEFEGLSVDGIAGPDTLRALYASLGEGPGLWSRLVAAIARWWRGG